MSGQRSKHQKLIAFPLDEALLDEIEKARGGKSRSQFIREALASYLNVESGITVQDSLIHAPDRVGKGGRPKKVDYTDTPGAIKKSKPKTKPKP